MRAWIRNEASDIWYGFTHPGAVVRTNLRDLRARLSR